MADFFTLFDTAVGRCAIAWNHSGVAGIVLPGAEDKATRAAVKARFPGARDASAPPDVQRTVDAVVAMLRGEPVDLAALPIDMEQVAKLLGKPGAASAIAAGAAAEVAVAAEVAEAVEEVALAIDLDEALRHLRSADKALGRLIDRVGPFGMRVAKTQSLFVALARAIVYQQLTGKAAGTIFGRVNALVKKAAGGLTAEGVLRVSDDNLREAGLSRSKLLSLKDLARRMVDGQLPSIDDVHAMEDAAIIEKLTEVRGIGRWTAEMMLMFRLGRPDVLPVDDYGIRKGFAATFGRADLPSREDLEKRGARWAPYRSVASWYLWRAAELQKKEATGKEATEKKATAKKATAKKATAKKATAKKATAKKATAKKKPAKR
jgi:3-methyladenine DNA glycosylase/8-oxoguanine DNA glycosylase